MYGLPSNYPAFVEYPKGGKGGVKVVRVAVQKCDTEFMNKRTTGYLSSTQGHIND